VSSEQISTQVTEQTLENISTVSSCWLWV